MDMKRLVNGLGMVGVAASLVLTLIVYAAIFSTGPAHAFGGGDEESKSDPGYAKAAELIKDGNYAAAIPFLEDAVAKDDRHADAYNYLGFSHRKLGRVETAIRYYKMALAVNSEHRGANEYLGELYLELGQPEKAEERLAILDSACTFGCEEYTELKESIATYRAAQVK